MERLFEIDLKDYRETDEIFRRPSARAIIFQSGRIALVYSKREKYYKFPGGGIHDDEDKKEALIREVREEAGMIVIPDSIREFGSVLRRQKSDQSENTIFEQENYYYFCDVQDKLVDQELDDYENDAEFVLRVVELDTAIRVNEIYKSDVFFDEVMIKRELLVLKLLKSIRSDKMQFKQGDGWKACYDEETGKYTAERKGPGYYHLYEITEEIFGSLTNGMNDWDSYHLLQDGRDLYMDVNDRCGPPYTIIFDHDYEKLCPWAKVRQSGKIWSDELTDAAVELFESQKNNREQRRKYREAESGLSAKTENNADDS